LVDFGGGIFSNGIVARDAEDQLALVGIAGEERLLVQRRVAEVEAQVGLAVLLVRPVAEVAVLGEDRADVAVEFHRAGRL
jgi:hypothetical protein